MNERQLIGQRKPSQHIKILITFEIIQNFWLPIVQRESNYEEKRANSKSDTPEQSVTPDLQPHSDRRDSGKSHMARLQRITGTVACWQG